jgi:hypothetical protein
MRFLNPMEAEFAKLIRSIRPVVRPRPEWKRGLLLRLLAGLEARQLARRAWRLAASPMKS